MRYGIVTKAHDLGYGSFPEKTPKNIQEVYYGTKRNKQPAGDNAGQ